MTSDLQQRALALLAEAESAARLQDTSNPALDRPETTTSVSGSPSLQKAASTTDMVEGIRPVRYPALKVTPKQGREPIHKDGVPFRTTVQDFWQWYVSDLVSNATRGVLAEFLVASALGLATGRTRTEWDPYDLLTEQGIRVEVKSAAYLQSWSHARLSTVQFGIRPSRALDASTNQYAQELKRQADVYVFCLLHHQDKQTVDPLNVTQWTFYVVAASVLDARFPLQKTITLSSLLALKPSQAVFGELAQMVTSAAGKAETE